MQGNLGRLISRFTNPGRVEWIGIRPERRTDMEILEAVLISETGLEGDRRSTPGKRAVTLIQQEHLSTIAALVGKSEICPATLRRNLVVSGINLLGLRNTQFRIGEAVLQGTGLCAPCSRMEDALGFGGYTAMRGHGGITASVVEGGRVRLGDSIHFHEPNSTEDPT